MPRGKVQPRRRGHLWPDPQSGPWQVWLQYRRDGDNRVVTGVHVEAAVADCPELTTVRLRTLSLPSIVRRDHTDQAARAEAALRRLSNPNLAAHVERRQVTQLQRQANEARPKLRPGRPPEYGDAHYSTIADAYSRLVTTGRPVKSIAEQMHVSPKTVDRWVREARRRGLLPQTQQGRARARRRGEGQR